MTGRAATKTLAGAIVCAVLLFGLVTVPSSSADAPGAVGTFRTKASNGNSIFGIAFSRRADGRGNVTLFVGKKGAGAVYFAPATVIASANATPEIIHPPAEIRADLGALGRIDLAFDGSSAVIERSPSACHGNTIKFETGSYQGAFEFHGEEGYAEANSTSVETSIAPLLSCGTSVGGETRGSPLPGARLRLSSHRGGRALSLQVNQNRPGARTIFEASLHERVHGIGIKRIVEGTAPSASFAFSSDLRRATLRPPAPFSGSAAFHREASPTNRLTGDLAVDFPGHSNVRLAGAGVKATLVAAQIIRRHRVGADGS